MSNLFLKYKKTFLVLFLLTVIMTLPIFVLFGKKENENNTASNQKTSNQNTNVYIDNNLSGSLIPTRVSIFTGSDEAANDKYLKEHPELFTEARLQEQVPIEYNNFTLDYSYDEDKFLVKLKPPYEQSKDAFSNWMKQLGLPDKNRFIITELK